MAVVYKATDERMKRTVAVKVLYPYLAGKEENKVRFQREAHVVASLDHRNIVRIHDYSGTDSEDNYIVAEFVEGITLKKFIGDRPAILPEVAVLMVEQVASALAYAHNQGITHRDVKPENVMIGPDGVLKLMDFGIAQIKDLQHMTVTGTMIGSPAHMSPEHIEGRKLDNRADIFSLGTVFYTLAVGELPFQASSAHALFRNILDVRYTPAVQARPAVGEEISQIIDRCLRKVPEERFQSCEELEQTLRAYVSQFGLEDPIREVARYFADPDEYERRAAGEIVTRLVEKGRSLVKTRKIATALRSFDRALALDPDREDVFEEIQRLQRRIELRRGLVRYGLPGLAAAAVMATGAYFITSPPGFLGATSQEQTDEPVPGGAGTHGFASPGPAAPDLAVPSEGAQGATRSAPVSPGGGDEASAGAQGTVAHGSANQGASSKNSTGSRSWMKVRWPRLDLSDLYAAATSPENGVGASERIRLFGDPEVKLDPGMNGVAAQHGGNEHDGDTNGGEQEPGKQVAGKQNGSNQGTAKHGDGKQDSGKQDAGRQDIGKQDAGKQESGKQESGKQDAGAQGTGKEPDGNAEAGKTDGSGKSEVAAAASLVPVEITANVGLADIFVDGQKVGTGKVVGLPLSCGPHVVRLSYPACPVCVDSEKTIVVRKGAESPRFRVEIGLKPAILRVASKAPGDVFLDGNPVGRTNARILVAALNNKKWTMQVKVLFDDKSIPHFASRATFAPATSTEVTVGD